MEPKRPVLDVDVLRVVAAHEADLHELAAKLGFSHNDPHRLSEACRQRLLAKDGLFQPQAFEYQLSVRGIGDEITTASTPSSRINPSPSPKTAADPHSSATSPAR